MYRYCGFDVFLVVYSFIHSFIHYVYYLYISILYTVTRESHVMLQRGIEIHDPSSSHPWNHSINGLFRRRMRRSPSFCSMEYIGNHWNTPIIDDHRICVRRIGDSRKPEAKPKRSRSRSRTRPSRRFASRRVIPSVLKPSNIKGSTASSASSL